MKRILLILGALGSLSLSVLAQDNAQKAAADAAAALAGAPAQEAAPPAKPKYWAYSSVLDLGVNQTSLYNWAAGGFGSINLTTGLDAKAYYTKERINWKNRLQLEFGFVNSQDKPDILQKSNDRIYFESKFSYSTDKKDLNWTASYDFRTQFSDSYTNYDYPVKWWKEYEREMYNDPQWSESKDDPYWQEEMAQMKEAWKEEWEEWRSGSIKSTFLSPAYNNIALGIEWKPVPWFDVNFSPLTGSVTIVTEPVLRKKYGMPENPNYDPAVVSVDPYYSALFQFGASIKANAKFSINDKFNYETQFVIFTDYLNHPFVQNRINWDNKIAWQITSFFKMGLSTWLLYDPVVNFGTDENPERKVQFKDFLSFNFTFTLGQKGLK
ncbi:MAG: DUF3078 domain-containing protein [Bacteroidales bacterium]|nr:DUF3078 domain-containing protein [Bacteroidales bacterium]